jgi:hypothetical protein
VPAAAEDRRPVEVSAYLSRDVTSAGVAETELSVDVVAPGPQAVVLLESQGVEVAAADLRPIAIRADRGRHAA